ncbi:Aldehyde/histidinol dehydrogenase [Gautieria morchelliformis]|nr:Aldehyde/histidinol dehydrogenase [Gautieria morchelliformis]
MEPIPDTPLGDIPSIHRMLKDSFRAGKLRPISYRRAQLAQLAYLLQDNYLAFQDALAHDFGKHPIEANIGELVVLFQRTLDAIANLEQWTENVDLSSDTNPMLSALKPVLIKQPRGPVLIIGPFNAPLLLTLQPLIGAIAAGCPAVVKPSDLSTYCSSLISRLVPKYLDADCYRVVLGGVDQSTLLLQLKWASVCYTGGMKVGRIVAAAAAKHMTPVTLELGGKCPVILDSQYDMELAARRILWGKMINAGQVCISPDYVLVDREKQDNLIAGLEKAWTEFFPNGSLSSPDTGCIINEKHYHRVMDMLTRTKGRIVVGGQVDSSRKKIDVTVVRDVRPGDSLLEDEIFGPVLAVVPVDNLEAALEFVADRPEPLAVYMFSSDESFKRRVRENTLSGALIVNDTFYQLAIPQLPVGGIGASGYGYQGGKFAFDTFIHNRASMDVPPEAEPLLAIRYPPYTKESYDALSQDLFQKVPLPRISTSTPSTSKEAMGSAHVQRLVRHSELPVS